MKFRYFTLSALLVFTLLVSSKTKADLIAYWPLDKIIEGKVIDATGNGHDGTVVGNLKPIEDANHKGLYFDGGASYVDCGSTGFDKINEQITISAWIKIAKFDKWIQTIVAKDSNIWGLQRGWSDSYHSVNFNVEAENGETVRAGGVMGLTDVDDNNWHHVAGVYDGQNLKVYIDGKLSNSVVANKRKLNKLQNKLTIGENLLEGESAEDAKYSRSWHGEISQVAIFDKALTLPQVEFLYYSDPVTCQKYSHYRELFSNSDIALIKDIDPKYFDLLLACKDLIDQKQYSKAIEVLDKLIRDDAVSNQQALITNKAIGFLDKLIQEKTACHQSFITSAFLLKHKICPQQDDIQNAFKEIKTLQEAYPEFKFPEVAFSMAYCYMKQGDNTQAQTLLRQIIDKYPQSTYAFKAQLCLSRIKGK